jgi:ketosteroid isomerase-like protein
MDRTHQRGTKRCQACSLGIDALILAEPPEANVAFGGAPNGRASDNPMMAPGNVELVRSIRAAWDRGDYSSTEWAHPQIEFVWADGPSPSIRTGLAAMAEGMRDFLSVWESFRAEGDEYREVDRERVLVLHHFQGRGKMSRLELGEMHAKGATLYHLQNGKVTRLVIYMNADQCLADIGLAPESDSPDT